MVNSRAVKSVVDPTNKYIAVAFMTSTRSEIQICDAISKKPTSTFELDSEDKISTIAWSHPVDIPRKTKKRGHGQDGSSDSFNGHASEFCYLIVALEQGDILIFSPLQKDIVNKVSNDSEIISLMSSDANSFYGLESSGAIKNFTLLENKIINTYQYTSDKALQILKQNNNDANSFVCSSNCLYIFDKTADNEGHLEVQVRLPVPRGHSSSINSIVQSAIHPDILITSRESDNIIHVYAKKTNTALLNASSTVSSLELLTVNSEEFLVALLDNGDLEIFRNFQEKRAKSDELHCFVKLQSKSSLERVYHDGSNFQCIWFEDNKLKSSIFTLDQSVVIIDSAENGHVTHQNNNGSKDNEEMEIVEDDEDVEENTGNENESLELDSGKYTVSTSDDLYRLLVSALEADDDAKLIDTCNSNSSDINIKQTLLKNVTADQASTLFKKLATELSAQPTELTTLSKWLKDLLLIHGNNIIQDEDNISTLKGLRGSLLDSTKYLPNLVALQGRLQLLKSQLQLRKDMSNLGVEDESEEDLDIEDQHAQNEAETNGSFYINGEGNDDVFEDDDPVDVDAEEDD